jgi:hypothetical protein
MAACETCGNELKKGVQFCKTCGAGAEAHNDDRKARVLAAEKGGRARYLIAGAAVAAAVAAWFILASMRDVSGGMPGMRTARSTANTTVYAPVTAQNGEVRIPMSALEGSRAGYFIYNGGGKDIKFFLIRASDGSVRAALDACQACYHAKLGYRQEGDNLVCNNCGMGFRSTDVGSVTGGCSPIPVQKQLDGQLLVLKVQELEDGAKYF